MSRVFLLGSDDELAFRLVGDLRRQRQHLTVEILTLGRVAHERPQLVVVEFLGDVVIRAVLHRLHGGLDLLNRGDHDHFDQAVVLLDDAEHLEAADARQAHVEQQQVDVLLVQHGQRGFAARDAQHAVLALENRGQRVAHPLIVVDDEDGLQLGSHFAHSNLERTGRIVSGG